MLEAETGAILRLFRRHSFFKSLYTIYNQYYFIYSFIWVINSTIFTIVSAIEGKSRLVFVFSIFLCLYTLERWFKILSKFQNAGLIIMTCKTGLGFLVLEQLEWNNFWMDNNISEIFLFGFWVTELMIGYLLFFIISLNLEEEAEDENIVDDLIFIFFKFSWLGVSLVLFYFFESKYSKNGSFLTIYLSLKMTLFFFDLYLRLNKRRRIKFFLEEEIIPTALLLPFTFKECQYQNTLSCVLFYFLSIIGYLQILYLCVVVIARDATLKMKQKEINRILENINQNFPEIDGNHRFLCNLCHSDFPGRWRVLNCHHHFHSSCLEDKIIEQALNNCPSCRQNI